MRAKNMLVQLLTL